MRNRNTQQALKQLNRATGMPSGEDPYKALLDEVRMETSEGDRKRHLDEQIENDESEFFIPNKVVKSFDPTATMFGEGVVVKHIKEKSREEVLAQARREKLEEEWKKKFKTMDRHTKSNNDGFQDGGWAMLDQHRSAEQNAAEEFNKRFMPKTHNDFLVDDNEDNHYGAQVQTSVGAKKVFMDEGFTSSATNPDGWKVAEEENKNQITDKHLTEKDLKQIREFELAEKARILAEKQQQEDAIYEKQQDKLKQDCFVKNNMENDSLMAVDEENIKSQWVTSTHIETGQTYWKNLDSFNKINVNPNLLTDPDNFAVVLDTNILLQSRPKLIELIKKYPKTNFHMSQTVLDELDAQKKSGSSGGKSKGRSQKAQNAHRTIVESLNRCENFVTESIRLKHALGVGGF